MNSRRQFVADAIGCEVHEGTLIAGIGNQELGVYVMFQRSVADDNEGVWFEFDDQVNGNCNQVASCRLHANVMTIDLIEPIDGVVGFDIKLDCQASESAVLREQLAAIFSNAPGILNVSESQ